MSIANNKNSYFPVIVGNESVKSDLKIHYETSPIFLPAANAMYPDKHYPTYDPYTGDYGWSENSEGLQEYNCRHYGECGNMVNYIATNDSEL